MFHAHVGPRLHFHTHLLCVKGDLVGPVCVYGRMPTSWFGRKIHHQFFGSRSVSQNSHAKQSRIVPIAMCARLTSGWRMTYNASTSPNPRSSSPHPRTLLTVFPLSSGASSSSCYCYSSSSCSCYDRRGRRQHIASLMSVKIITNPRLRSSQKSLQQLLLRPS